MTFTTTSEELCRGLDAEDSISSDTSSIASNETNEDTGSVVEAEQKTRTFTCFNELAPELRLRIWKFACFLPRNVCVETDKKLMERLKNNLTPDYWVDRVAYHSNSDPPAVLQACRESRLEAQKHYSLEFGTNVTFSIRTGHHSSLRSYNITVPPVVWINWDVDTVWMPHVPWGEDHEHHDDLAKLFDAKGLKSLALNIPWGNTDTLYTVPAGGRLQELILFSCGWPEVDGIKNVDFRDIEHGKQKSKWKSALGEHDFDSDYDKRYFWNLLDGGPKHTAKWLQNIACLDTNRVPPPKLRICELVNLG